MKRKSFFCFIAIVSIVLVTPAFVTAQPTQSINILGNSGAVINGNQIGRDLNVSYPAWDINRQPIVTPFAKIQSNGTNGFDEVKASELLIEQIKRDKEFASFLLNFTGATGRLSVLEAQQGLDKAIEKGSALAAVMRAIAYQNGFWEARNPREATRLYILAANKGHAGAQAMLSEQYWFGTFGVKEDKIESTKYLEKLVDNENAEKAIRGTSAFWLGNRYISGDLGKKDICLGVRTWAIAANLGNADAMFNLGIEREEKNRCLPIDKMAALTWFERGANTGDPANAIEAGRMQQFGLAGHKDFLAAERHYLAAGSDFPYADSQLAWIYAKGLNSATNTPDYNKAISYARRAASKNNAHAMTILGLLYEYGLGVKSNTSEAFRWYGKAAANGDASGLINQATLRINGCVGAEEMPNWLTDLTKVTEDRSQHNLIRAMALLQLGHAYLFNNAGLEKDQRKALGIFEKSCSLGDGRACYQVVDLKNNRETNSDILKSAERSKNDAMIYAGERCSRSVAVQSKDPESFP